MLSGGSSGALSGQRAQEGSHSGQEQTKPLFFQTLLSAAGLVGRGRIPSSSW